MLERMANVVVRRRRRVLVAALVVFAVCGAVGGGVAEHLSSGGFEDPRAESTRAQRIVDQRFGAGSPNLVLLVTAKGGDVDSPEAEAAGAALTAEVAALPGIDQAVSYWTLGNAPPLRSAKGNQALVLARIAGDEDQVDARVAELSPQLTGERGALTVGVGGFAEVFRQVGTTIEGDLAKAEGVALPITLLLLVLVFGSVVAAGLPVAIGVLSIVGTFFVLFVVSRFTQVSIFALNLTTAMGLGLAIDYSLFVVSRFREELARGMTSDAAVVRAVATAGRTVVFSALTVAASLAALLVFPLAFLRSFAYAGIAVVGVAAVASVVVLPAVLAALGPRVDRFSIRRRRPEPTTTAVGFWHDQAVRVMARPWRYAVGVTAVLLFLGAPFLHIRFGLPDDRVLPAEATSRVVQDQIRAGFSSQEAGAAAVVALGVDAMARASDVDAFATRLSTLDGVSRVDAATGYYAAGARILPANDLSSRFVKPAGTYFNVVPSVEPVSGEGERLVARDPNPRRPLPRAGGGYLGSARRCQGGHPGQGPARRRPHRPCDLHGALLDVRERAGADQGGGPQPVEPRPRPSGPWCGSSRRGTSAVSSGSRPPAPSTPRHRS